MFLIASWNLMQYEDDFTILRLNKNLLESIPYRSFNSFNPLQTEKNQKTVKLFTIQTSKRIKAFYPWIHKIYAVCLWISHDHEKINLLPHLAL